MGHIGELREGLTRGGIVKTFTSAAPTFPVPVLILKGDDEVKQFDVFFKTSLSWESLEYGTF